MISFLKIIAATKRSRKMKKYANHAGLNKRMPNYEVKMGFGLHQGWAIEGAIGTQFKIDASYLSPNVNMSGRLEETTKAYGVPLLISGQLFDNLSEGCQDKCRWIDHYKPAELKEDLRLYTVDVDATNLALEPVQAPLNKQQRRSARVKARLHRNNFKEALAQGGIDVSMLFETDEDLK